MRDRPTRSRSTARACACGASAIAGPREWHRCGTELLTAATLPSVEDIVMGAIPGLPKVVVHWPLVDYQVGDEFMQWFWKADAGELDPFVLIVEGSIPNEAIKSEGYWAGFGNNPATGQPITVSEWLGPLAPTAPTRLAEG